MNIFARTFTSIAPRKLIASIALATTVLVLTAPAHALIDALIVKHRYDGTNGSLHIGNSESDNVQAVLDTATTPHCNGAVPIGSSGGTLPPGCDASGNNGIVRTNDRFSYAFSPRTTTTNETNIVITATLPLGNIAPSLGQPVAKWDVLPGFCEAVGSSISSDGRTITCRIASIPAPGTVQRDFIGRILPNAPNGTALPVPIVSVSSDQTPVTVAGTPHPTEPGLPLVITAGAKYDLEPRFDGYYNAYVPNSNAAGNQAGIFSAAEFRLWSKAPGGKGVEMINNTDPGNSIRVVIDISGMPAGTLVANWNVPAGTTDGQDGCVSAASGGILQPGATQGTSGILPHPGPMENTPYNGGAANTTPTTSNNIPRDTSLVNSCRFVSRVGNLVTVDLYGVLTNPVNTPRAYASSAANSVPIDDYAFAFKGLLLWTPYSAFPPSGTTTLTVVAGSLSGETITGQTLSNQITNNNVATRGVVTTIAGFGGKNRGDVQRSLDPAIRALPVPIRANVEGGDGSVSAGQVYGYSLSVGNSSVGTMPVGLVMMCDKFNNAKLKLLKVQNAGFRYETNGATTIIPPEYGVGGAGISGYVPGSSGGTWTSVLGSNITETLVPGAGDTSTAATAGCSQTDAAQWFTSEALLQAAGYTLKDVTRIRYSLVTAIGPGGDLSGNTFSGYLGSSIHHHLDVEALNTFAYPQTLIGVNAGTYPAGAAIPRVGSYENYSVQTLNGVTSHSYLSNKAVVSTTATTIVKTTDIPAESYNGLTQAGGEVTYRLQATYSTRQPAAAGVVTITDVLPPGLSYVAGSASITPSQILSNTLPDGSAAAGYTTIRWAINNLTPVYTEPGNIAGNITPITFRALIATGLANSTTLTNSATVHGTNDSGGMCVYSAVNNTFNNSPCFNTRKQAQKNIQVSVPPGFAIQKYPLINPISPTQNFTYRVRYGSLLSTLNNVPRILDIFPFVIGHKGATTNDSQESLALGRTARVPSSTFTADGIAFNGFTAPVGGGVMYYTTVAPDTINADPQDLSNTGGVANGLPSGIWSSIAPTPLSNTTGLIWIPAAVSLPANVNYDLDVSFTSAGTIGSQTVANGVTARNLAGQPDSLIVVKSTGTQTIQAASLCGRVYFDASNNNGFDTGADTPLQGVRLRLTGTSTAATGSQAVNLSVLTDVNGNYCFSPFATNIRTGAGAGTPIATFAGLLAGTYTLAEEDPSTILQPYSDGPDQVGSSGGTAGAIGTDQITNIVLSPGDNAVAYDFLEKRYDLKIFKSGSTTGTVGTPINYNLNIENVGAVATGSNAYTVTDDIDSTKFTVNGSVSFIPAVNTGGWACTVTPNTPFIGTTRVQCASSSNIAAGAANTTTLVINVTPLAAAATSPATGIQTNTASVSVANDAQTTNNTATLQTTFAGVVDLEVTKTGPTTGAVGVPMSWTLQVKNSGSAVTGTNPYVVRDFIDTTKFSTITGAGTGWVCATTAAGAADPDAGSYGIAPGTLVPANRSLVRCITSPVVSLGIGLTNANNVSINVTPLAAALGNYTNTARVDGGGEIVGSTAQNNNNATQMVNVVQYATLTKSFVTSPLSTPATIVAGGTANLVFTITNPINNPAQTGISFTDSLPAGLVVGTGPINNSCSPAGSVTATAGSTTVNASTIGVSAGTATPTICVISVPVTTAAGVTNAACPAATNTTNGAANVATTGISNGVTNQCLTVVAAPTLVKSFTPAGPVAAGTPVVMTFVLGNQANNPAMTDVGFTDTLPAGMVFSPAAPTLGGTCASTSGAALVRSVSGTALTVSGVDIAASGASATTCTVTVTSVVIGAANQSLTNTTSAPTATIGGIPVTGLVATAPLATTTANPPTISKAFGAASIQAGGTTTLTITLSNNNLVPAVLSSALVDTFPTTPGAMTLANNIVGGTCTAANVTATTGAGQLSYNTNGVIPAATAIGTPGTCTIIVNVTAPVAGTYVNNIAAGALGTNVGDNPAPAQATLVVNNAPTIAKAFNPTSIPANGTSKLTITLTNNNPTVATLTSNLDDVISAAGFTFTSFDAAASTCTGTKSLPNATTVRYASGATIPAASGGTAGTCTIVVNTTGTTSGTLTNTIPAGALVTDKGNNPAPAVATLTVTNAPTVAKAFSPNTIKAGDVSQLTITLTNNNPTAATLTTPFTDTLPPGVTLANTNFGGSCGPANVSGSAGGNTVTYAQNATIPGGAPGSCTITANVTSTASGAYMNTIFNNTLQTSNGNQAAVATAPLTVLVPPTITKAFAPPSIAPGATSILTMVLTNPNAAGTPNLTGVTVSDTLPTGMVLLAMPIVNPPACGAPVASPATNSLSLTVASMTPGQTCTITAPVTMAAPNTTLNNTTSTPTASGPVALTGTTATAPLTTTTSTAPTVAKSFNPVNIPVGGTSVLTITLTNNNLVPAVLSAALEDMLPPGVTVANTVFGGSCIMLPALNGNSNTISAAAGDTSVFYTANSYIPPSTVNGGTCNLLVTVTSSTPGAKVNVIDPGKLQTNMGNNNAVASATMSVVAPPTVTKTISPSPINIGAPSTMTITITNPAGNVALTSVGITDTLPGVAPNDMTFVNNTVGGTCTGTTKSIAGNVLTFAGGTLAAGSSCTLTSTVTIKAGSTTLTNTTTAPTATGGTGAGINVAGNTANADLTTNPAVAPTLAKAFTPATIQTGAVSVLSITVTNNNAVAATLSSALTDALPAGVTVASPVGFATTAGCSAAGAGPAAGATGSVTVLPANAVVAAGAPGTCVVSFNVTSTTGGTVTNTIPVGALATNNGSNPTAATAPLTVLLPPTVAKSFSPTSIPVNGVSTLTITLTNPNATTATLSAPLSDNLPANVVLAASPAPSSNCTNASVVGLPGSTAVTLQAGASIPGGTPSGVCTITAYVTSSVASATPYVNTIPLGSLQTNNGNQATVANASLTVTSPLLALTKSAPSPALAVGATSTYTLTVTNTGNGAATVAAIKESIPANMQYTGFAGAGWTCPAAPITGATTIDCTYAGSIAAAGGTTALTVDMKPLAAAAIPATGVTNKASVGTTGGTSVPVDPTTCTAAAVGASNTALPTAGCASNTALVQAIDVVKSVNTAATKSGPLSFDVPYKVIVKSTGSAAATNFQAVENLATTFATGSPTLAWVAGSAPTVLAATGGATAGQCVLNAAFVAAPSATNMFSGNQSLPTGGACEITFIVRVTYPSAAVIPAAAQNNSVVATTSATAGGTPLASDTSTSGTTSPATPNGDVALVTPVLLPLNPVLGLVKSAPTPTLAVGVESTYSLTVGNTGNLVANSATVQEAIPANVQYTGFAGTGWACLPAAPATGPVAVTCTFTGAGAAGIAAISGTSVLSIKVKPLAAAAGTTVTNKASVDPTGGTTPPSATTCTALNTPTAGCAAPRSDDIQTIDVVKSLNTAVTVVNGNTFDVPYKVIVKNVGATVAATNFQAVESLATTFATGTPTLAWTSVALQPTVTAVAPATAAQCLLNPAFVSAPSATNMFDGRQTLPAGGACSVTFTVRVTYASPAAVPTATTQDNSVTATTYTTAPAAAGGTGTGVVVSDVSTNSAISPATPGADTASATPVSLVILPADLSIQKNGPAMITNGGALVYTLTVRNAGPGVANGATYLDTLPAGLTAISASCGAPTAGASCAVPTVTGVASVSGTVPMLPAGGSVTITINATAPAAGLTALVNNSSVASPAGIPDPTPSNNTSSVTTNIVTVLPKQADISIVKTGATTVAPSGVMSYLLTVTNAGPGAANGSTVADAVPATVTGIAATCVSATGGASCTAPTVSGNNVAATIATLPANATVVYQITGTAPASGTVVNTATVKVPVGITDPNPANNSSTATSTIGAITGNANVAVIKTGDTSAPVNGTVTYKITVSNAGPDAANGTQLSDIVPAELSNVAASCGVATGGAVCAAPSVAANTVTATIATLPANSTVTYTITAKAPATPARFSNSATVTLPPGIADPNPSDNVGGPVITQITGGAAVSGTVYKDANRNSVKDAAELPVAGVIVTLRNAAGTVIGTTTTDAKGNYTFANVPAGTGYSVGFNYGTSPQGVASPTGTANDPLSGNANGLQSITGITVLNDNVTLDQNARLVDPSGVVYDAITRKPVAGATVCLAANGTLVTNAQLSPATPNCQVTDATGAYTFFINATAPTGAYTLQVTQPAGYLPPNAVQGGVSLPSAAGYNVPAAPGVSAIQAQAVAPTGAQPTTYYFLFNNFGPASQDVIQNHIPLDPIANAKLLVIKTAAKATAEVGDSMTYTITVKRTDTAAGALPSFVVVDTLPVGFTYIPGTAMVNGATVTDTSIGLAAQGSKPVMNMAFTTPLSAGQQMSLTYRVRIGVGAAEGSGTNRASAKYNAGIDCTVEPNKCSNEARATVKVTAGVFTPQACVIGKVYADCNKNGIQDNEEIGIPGVKLYMLDGTSIITDVEGKYSICDLKPQTGVLAVDRSTMPRGSLFGTTSNRNALDGSSLFIDLKKGEMHRADFSEASCSNGVLEQIKSRRAQGEVRAAETEKSRAITQPSLNYQAKPVADPIQTTDGANQPAINVRQNNRQ